MYLMADGLTRLIAPILSFTADELWRFLPGEREESVHIAVFPIAAPSSTRSHDPELVERWNRLIALREQVLAEIEPLRKEQADRQLAAGQGRACPRGLLTWRCSSAMPRICRCCSSCPTSSCGRRPPGTETRPQLRLAITIERAGGVKCERCWRYVDQVSNDPAWAGFASAARMRWPKHKWHDRSNRSTCRRDRWHRRADAVAGRRLELWLPIAHRRIRSADESDRPVDAAAAFDSVTVIPGLLDFTHVRNTRRGVRHL